MREAHAATLDRRRSAVDDRTLIDGTLAGRQEDFAVLVERYQKMLYAFVQQRLRDADAADEVVQQTFVRAYTRLASFRGDSGFKTWLHQIALNQCRALRRARAARRAVPLDEVPEAELPAAAEYSQATGWRATLGRLVARLPARQRTVLMLRVGSDLAFKDIARVEGISENAAKVNYYHAVIRLRQWLVGEHP